MNREQYEQLRRPAKPVAPTMSIDEIGRHDRTLAFGYMRAWDTQHAYTQRTYTWHAYVRDSEIHVVVYGYNADYLTTLISHTHGESLPLEALRPSKRVYPERCDFEFARLMKSRGFSLPFTTWDDRWGDDGPTERFHGLVFNTDTQSSTDDQASTDDSADEAAHT